MKVSKVKIKLLRCVTVETNKWSSMRTAESRAAKGKIHFMLHRLPGKFIHIVSIVCNIFASSKKLYKKGKKSLHKNRFRSIKSRNIAVRPEHFWFLYFLPFTHSSDRRLPKIFTPQLTVLMNLFLSGANWRLVLRYRRDSSLLCVINKLLTDLSLWADTLNTHRASVIGESQSEKK